MREVRGLGETFKEMYIIKNSNSIELNTWFFKWPLQTGRMKILYNILKTYSKNLQQSKTNDLIFTKLLFFFSLMGWLTSFGGKAPKTSYLNHCRNSASAWNTRNSQLSKGIRSTGEYLATSWKTEQHFWTPSLSTSSQKYCEFSVQYAMQYLLSA